jgi:hypothetical protein
LDAQEKYMIKLGILISTQRRKKELDQFSNHSFLLQKRHLKNQNPHAGMDLTRKASIFTANSGTIVEIGMNMLTIWSTASR